MWPRNLLAVVTFCLLSGCQSQKPLETVDYVDLQRFMGDWYVIANIPTFLEKNAYNPIESYALDTDGSIATTFSFNADSLEGEKRSIIRGVSLKIPRPMLSGACSFYGL